MNDRELLELAAKVAGVQPGDERLNWNPLADDGDALRLAVRCAQLYGWRTFIRRWLVAMMNQGGLLNDHTFATRRAIVRAAAAVAGALEAE